MNAPDPRPTAATMDIPLTVNGRAQRVTIEPGARLSDALRDHLGLTGTKIGCSAGDCGACTVLIDGAQACACLVPVARCRDRQVTTVEGLARADGTLSALQRAFIAHGAAQCGICTPGMLMAAADTLRRHPQPTEQQVLDGLGGVLCRCTGYRKIVEAVLAVGQGAASDDPAALAADVRARADAIGARMSAATGIGSPAVALGEPGFGDPAHDFGPSVDAAHTPAGRAVGARMHRLDVLGKVTGSERYGADVAPADALWVRAIRSPHPAARFEFGDLDAFVAATPGLAGVVLPSDIPNNRFAIFPDLRDQPALAQGRVRMRGEAVLALAGERRAVEAVDPAALPIRWQVDTPALQYDEALAPDAMALQDRYPDNVLCRGRLATGDVDGTIADAPLVFEEAMRTQHVEHAYIEPEAGYAQWGDDGRVTVFATTQTPYMDRDELAWMFGLAPEQVRIVPSAVGGGFGGKLDLSIQPLIVAAARKFGRPARMVYERWESMVSTTKRHPARMQARLAADPSGRFLAYDFTGDFNTGPYASWGPTVANRVPIHASGPYRFGAVRATTRAVLTNNANCGAFRGFGVPQATLLNELLIDRLARQLRVDPLDLRYANALRAGDATPSGQRLSASVGLQACLDALRPAWREARERAQQFNAQRMAAALNAGGVMLPAGDAQAAKRRGVGVACMWYGIGNTVIANPSTMTIGLRRDGRFMLYNGAIDIGQGTYTIMPQIAADALGVPVGLIDQVVSDTDLTRDAGKSSASRQTFVSGNAARFAGEDLRAKLLALLGLPPEGRIRIDGDSLVGEADVIGQIGQTILRRVALASLPVDANGDVAVGEGYFNPPTVPLDADGQGVPYATYGFAAQFAEIEIDVVLGTVTVLSIHAAHDVGRAVNPTQVEGQVHGGVAQGLGLALMEDYIAGRTDNLHDYLIPTVGDLPPITVHLIEDPEPLGPFGAKGVGEPALVATAPAILNAIHHATGVQLTEVPATPDRVRAALRAASGASTR